MANGLVFLQSLVRVLASNSLCVCIFACLLLSLFVCAYTYAYHRMSSVVCNVHGFDHYNSYSACDSLATNGTI